MTLKRLLSLCSSANRVTMLLTPVRMSVDGIGLAEPCGFASLGSHAFRASVRALWGLGARSSWDRPDTVAFIPHQRKGNGDVVCPVDVGNSCEEDCT